jgi:hypothetical protein
VNLFSYSKNGTHAISQFYSEMNKDINLHRLKNKIDKCDYNILVIANDPVTINGDHALFINDIASELSKASTSIFGEGRTKMIIQTKGWKIIDKYGEKITKQNDSNPYVRRMRELGKENTFFILLTGQEQKGLPWVEIYNICNLWQLEHGSLPLHAAGIVRHGNLFLFAGHSGAGKSTVSTLSQEIGGHLLDEDEVLVHLLGDGYTADGWGYNIIPGTAPLKAIFHLVQDNEDRITPLTQSQNTRFLLFRASETFGNEVSSDSLQNIFMQAANISRSVPGFELRFRKGPAFWDLIDERFPS